MQKIEMREWVANVEKFVDEKLQRWKKGSRIENGESIQMCWQFEQTHFLFDIFWEDGKEMVQLQYHSPRTTHRYEWHGLNGKTFNKILDRVGNLAQVTMHPPIDSD